MTKRKKKKRATEGYAFDFHGAFAKKAPAVAKAAEVRKKEGIGFTIFRHIGRGWRYVVLGERAPF